MREHHHIGQARLNDSSTHSVQKLFTKLIDNHNSGLLETSLGCETQQLFFRTFQPFPGPAEGASFSVSGNIVAQKLSYLLQYLELQNVDRLGPLAMV